MKTILTYFILILLSCSTQLLQAQKIDRQFNKHYIGGDLSIQIGTIINLNIAPHYGYYFMPKISAGLGVNYQYYNNALYSPPLEMNIFGGRIFARYDIIDWLFIHAENEILTYKTNMFHPLRKMEQIVSNNVLAGAGYRQLFSAFDKDNAYIMLLYNFNETIYTPYSNPVIRIGIEFHF